jgi:voltage-gated potassium channel Kch
MSHEMSQSLGSERGWRTYVIPGSLALAWVALIIILGYTGYKRANEASVPPGAAAVEKDVGKDPSDRLYRALQLFVLHGEIPKQMNWQLQAARFLAPAGELVGVIVGLMAMAKWTDAFRRFGLMRARRGHIVICGLGRKGLRLARDLSRQGERVLVIDKEAQNPFFYSCDQLGVLVVIGDATKVETLREARLPRAKYLIATCGDDGANIEIAVLADYLLSRQKRKRSRLPCYVHIVDLELRTLFKKHKTFEARNEYVNATMFNVFENSARLLFRTHFLDYGVPITDTSDGRQAHLVLFGFGPLSESVALQAVQLTHFPNERKLRLTVIDSDATRKHKRFQIRYEAFHKLCDARFIESDAERPAIFRLVEQWSADRESIVTFVVALDNDSHSLSLGLSLFGRVKQHGCRIFVRATSDAGLAELFSDAKKEAGLMPEISSFGKVEEACSADVVVGESLNKSAQMIHAHFAMKRTKEGRKPNDPSVLPWNDLDLDLKESNWLQAEHIRFKVRAIGCNVAFLADCPPPDRLDNIGERDLEKLARIEHRRWMAERLLGGWKLGERKIPGQRIHPDLKPWKELTEGVKKYDVEAVQEIPGLLELNKQVICCKATIL